MIFVSYDFCLYHRGDFCPLFWRGSVWHEDIGAKAAVGLVYFYASVIIVAVSVCLIIFDDNALQKWLDRCCFSKVPKRDQFDDLTEELSEFHQAIQGHFNVYW